MEGYIKLWRKILEWEWHTCPNTFYLFIYLLLKATHKDTSFQGHTISRGQAVFGRKQASKDTGISEQSIRTSLTNLKSTNEITVKTTNRFSIITILNYDIYQSNEEKNNQQINQLANQQLTSNQPATNHIQEVKNIKNNNIIRPTKDQALALFEKKGGAPSEAEKFWEYYEMVGWVSGPSKKPIKKWEMAASQWIRRNNGTGEPSPFKQFKLSL